MYNFLYPLYNLCIIPPIYLGGHCQDPLRYRVPLLRVPSRVLDVKRLEPLGPGRQNSDSGPRRREFSGKENLGLGALNMTVIAS